MKSFNNKIRFGLIGCGRIAKQHLASIKFLPQAELKAVCDIVVNRARGAAKDYGVDWYSDYHELLQRKDIDVVSICTPNGLHVPMAMSAARAGKDVLSEKPLGINLKEVDKLLKFFKQQHRKLFAVLQVRFNPPIRALKRLISQGAMGYINNVSLVVRWARPQEYFDKDEWRGTKKMDGGTLLNQGIHYIDVLQWLLGDVVSVFAKKDCLAHKIEVEDVAMALLKFKNGAYGILEFTVCAYPKNLECSISVLGSRGTVKIGGPAANEIEIWEVANLPQPTLPPGFAPNVYASGLYQGSCPNHVFVYQELLKHLNNSHSDFIAGEDARKSLEIVEAIYRSAKIGREVKLPLKN